MFLQPCLVPRPNPFPDALDFRHTQVEHIGEQFLVAGEVVNRFFRYPVRRRPLIDCTPQCQQPIGGEAQADRVLDEARLR